MAKFIFDGWLEGKAVRRARKPGRCQYWRGRGNGGNCRNRIEPGQFYAEGDYDDCSESPFARQRYCLTCAGDEAIATVALIGC
jgi:hypothetical protein